MMPHKSWEIGGLAVLLLLYFYGVWPAFSKTANSGWKWNYCLISGVLIIAATAGLLCFLRSTRR